MWMVSYLTLASWYECLIKEIDDLGLLEGLKQTRNIGSTSTPKNGTIRLQLCCQILQWGHRHPRRRRRHPSPPPKCGFAVRNCNNRERGERTMAMALMGNRWLYEISRGFSVGKGGRPTGLILSKWPTNICVWHNLLFELLTLVDLDYPITLVNKFSAW